MSVRVNRNYSRSNENTEKKFCGVCQKAGLSEKEYTSHFTKSVPGPHGTVICPTILKNECSFCFQFGHFKSACPAIAERERQQKKSEMQEKRLQFKQEKQPVQKQVSVNRGGFSVLDDGYESDEKPVGGKRTFSQANRVEKVAAKVDEWPVLSINKVNATVVVDKPSFATVISTPAPMKKADSSRANICGFTVISKTGVTYTPSESVIKPPVTRVSWFDMNDEDDDDEEYVDNSAW
jgi:hypothetical protein